MRVSVLTKKGAVELRVIVRARLLRVFLAEGEGWTKALAGSKSLNF